jgi:hypothetical protein
MRWSTLVLAGVMSGVAGTSVACTMPKLAVIPPKAEVAGKEAAVQADANRYFTEMQAYTTCLLDELKAAGGDSAPDLLRRILVARNNTAVAEAEFMMKLFTENVAPAVTVPAPAN